VRGSCESRCAWKYSSYGLDTSSGVRAEGSGGYARCVLVAASREVLSTWEYSSLGFDFGSGRVRVARLVREVRGACREMRLARFKIRVGRV
jgi:hypothetical protein